MPVRVMAIDKKGLSYMTPCHRFLDKLKDAKNL